MFFDEDAGRDDPRPTAYRSPETKSLRVQIKASEIAEGLKAIADAIDKLARANYYRR
jgi:hypothetical protein